MRDKSSRTFLYIAVIAAVLPVIIMRDFTPSNELRYLSIADEALRNGSIFTFTNHGVPYCDKPPFYLWIIILCRWLTGAHHMWLLSLFSVVPALAIVDIIDRWTANEMGASSHAIARLMTLSAGLFLTAALTIRMDMLMCLFIVLALREFWRMYNDGEPSTKSRWLFPLWIFLGVFTKGPLGLLIPLVSTAVFLLIKGELRLMPRFWGWRTWTVLIGLIAAWFGAVAAEAGTGYLYDMTMHQTFGRAFKSFHHKAPFYYYALHYWYCLAPWSMLVAGVVVKALEKRTKRDNLEVFFLTVAVSTLCLLTCFSGKLQVYMLPAVPFLTYPTAMFIERYSGCRWVRYSLAVPAAIFIAALPAFLVAEEYVSIPGRGFLIAAATMLTITGCAVLHSLYCKSKATGLLTTVRIIGYGMLAAIFTGAFAMPQINSETGYKEVCQIARQEAERHHTTDYRAWKLKRPENMDVYLHHNVRIIASNDKVDADKRPYIIITKKSELGEIRMNDTKIIGNFAVGVVAR